MKSENKTALQKKNSSIFSIAGILFYVCLFAVGIIVGVLVAGRGSGRGTLRTGRGLGAAFLVELDDVGGHENEEHRELKDDAKNKGRDEHKSETSQEAAFGKQHEKADGNAKDGEKDIEETVELFKKVSGNEKLEVKFEVLADEGTPALLNISEEARRMDDMMKFYAANGGFEGMNVPVESTLILNTGSSLIKKLSEDVKSERSEIMAHQIYMLALLSQRQLSADELQEFLKGSFKLLEDRID